MDDESTYMGAEMPPRRSEDEAGGSLGGPVSRALRSLLGINEQVLSRAWCDARHYTIIAVLALLIAGLAFISMTLAVTFTLGNDAICRALAVGVAWGVLILTLDLLLLVPEPGQRGVGTGKRAGKMAVRLALAGLLGFLIAEPLLATLMRQDVDREQAAIHAEGRLLANSTRTADRAAEEDRLSAAHESLISDKKDALANAKDDATTKASKSNADQQACNDEVQGTGGSNKRGDGDVASVVCAPVEASATAAANADILVKSRTDQLTDAVADVELKVDGGLTAWDKTNPSVSEEFDANSLGVWDRVRATNDLMGKWHWAAAGVLVLIDSLPVLFKMLKGVTTYEERLFESLDDAGRDLKAELDLRHVGRVAQADARLAYIVQAAEEEAEVDARLSRARRGMREAVGVAAIRAKAALAGVASHRVDGHRQVGRFESIGEEPATMPESRRSVGTAPISDDSVPIGETEIDPAFDDEVLRREEGASIRLGDREYRLVDQVGEGGFAEIWRVIPGANASMQEKGTQIVAKLVRTGSSSGPTALKPSDAELALSLEAERYRHFRNTISASAYPRVFHAVDEGVVMQYYPRSSLDQWVFRSSAQPRPFTYRHLIRWYRDMLAGLDTIWESGLVHGDGKPQNLLMTGPAEGDPPNQSEAPDKLLIADLGSMVAVRSDAAFVSLFSSPIEAMTGGSLEWYADVFSFFGGVSHFLVSGGRMPWTDQIADARAWNAASPQERAHCVCALMSQPITPIEKWNRSVPSLLTDTIERWLDPVPLVRVRLTPGTEPAKGAVFLALKAQIDALAQSLPLDTLVLEEATVPFEIEKESKVAAPGVLVSQS